MHEIMWNVALESTIYLRIWIHWTSYLVQLSQQT